MNNGIQIRPAEERDAYAVQVLRKQGWQDNYQYPAGGVTLKVLKERLASLPPTESDLRFFKENLAKPENKNKMLTAELSGDVVGVVFYDTLDNGNGDIGVFVNKEHRGRNIGTKLLKNLI